MREDNKINDAIDDRNRRIDQDSSDKNGEQ